MMRRKIANAVAVSMASLIVLLSALPALAKMPTALQTNQSIAVIAILGQTDFVPDRVGSTPIGLPDALADRVSEKLSKSKRFIPVEREALRRVIIEQRFGQRLTETYLDRTLNQAISKLDSMESQGDRIAGTGMKIEIGMGGVSGGMQMDSALAPKPVGEGIYEGEGIVGTTGVLSNFNDILKDFLDLGAAAETDFIVFGSIEKIDFYTQTTPVPYSESRVEIRNQVQARARIRIIDTKKAMVVGAASFEAQLDDSLFSNETSTLDDAAIYDVLANDIASEIIDIVYPARIASVDPFTITRGENDLVSEGDRYSVLREGDIIRDQDDVVLGRLTQQVGLVTVTQSEENFSLVNAIENESIKVGDLVKRSKPENIQATGGMQSVPIRQGQTTIGKTPTLGIGTIHFSSKQDAGKESPQIFTNTLISSLANTKRFDVVDRQELDQLLTEQQATLMREGEMLPSAIGTLIGADYLVLGTVTVLSIVDKETRLPGSSRVFQNKIGHVEGNVRITDVNSGVVFESRKISVSHTLENNQEKSQLLTQLADKFAYASVETVLNAIYPFKIMAASSNGVVYLNRGVDGGLSNGDILTVFRQGKAILDPDSNRNMGYEEFNMGELSITEVEDTRSKAVLLSGGPFATGDILKRSGQTLNTVKAGSSMTSNRSAAANNTLAVRLMSMDSGLTANGISDAKLKYLSNVLIAQLAETSKYTIVERLDIDSVLDEKTMTAIINNSDVTDSFGRLSEAAYILVGGITTMSFEAIEREIPYVNRVEIFHIGNIEGVFKIINSKTGEIVSVKTVTTTYKLEPSVDHELTQNTLLRGHAKEVATALTTDSAQSKPEVEAAPAREVAVPAW